MRLDRGFANGAFLNISPEVKVWHLQTTESDHCALLIECVEFCRWRRRRRHFRYENMWQWDPTYMDIVRNAWQVHEGPATLQDVQQQLGSIKNSLQGWERMTFSSVCEELARLRRDLEQVRGGGFSRYRTFSL